MSTAPRKKPRWGSLWSMSSLMRSLRVQDSQATNGSSSEVLAGQNASANHNADNDDCVDDVPPVARPARTKSVAFVDPEPADDSPDLLTMPLIGLDGTYLGNITDIGQRSFTATGGVASVSMGTLNTTGVLVVLKELFRSMSQVTGREDIFWIKASQCKHVLPFLGRSVIDKTTFLVSPFMPNGDLSTCLRAGVLCSATEVAKYLRQVLSGLKFLHEELVPSVVHGDLKADNIVIDEQGNALIADFGLSRHQDRQPDDPITAPGVRTMGTRLYLSVEQHRHKVRLWEGYIPFERKAVGAAPAPDFLSKLLENDLWAIGILIVHMYALQTPWENENDFNIPDYLALGLRHWYPSGSLARDRGLDFRLWRIAQDCWSQLPGHRPKASTILERLDAAPSFLNSELENLIKLEHEVIDLSGEIYDHWPDHAVRPAPQFPNPIPCVAPKDSVQSIGFWVPGELTPPRDAQVVLATRRFQHYSINDDGWAEDLRREVLIWSQLRHGHLLPLLGVSKIRGIWHTITPYWQSAQRFKEVCGRHARESTIFSPKESLPLAQVLLAVAKALQFLHKQDPPIIHGAVCLDNVVVGDRATRDARAIPATRAPTYIDACLGNYTNMRSLEPGETVECLSSDIYDFGIMLRQYLSGFVIFSDDCAGQEHPPYAAEIPGIAALYEQCVDKSVFFAADIVVGRLERLLLRWPGTRLNADSKEDVSRSDVSSSGNVSEANDRAPC